MKLKTFFLVVLASLSGWRATAQYDAGGVSYYGPGAPQAAAAARAQIQAAAVRDQQQAIALRAQQTAKFNAQQDQEARQALIDKVYLHYPTPIDTTGRFRIFDGQLYSVYNAISSPKFEWVPPNTPWYHLEQIMVIGSNSILCSVYGDKQMSDASQVLGITPQFPEDAQKNQEFIKKVIIFNSDGLVEGKTLNCKAVRVNNSVYNLVSYETYDCGLPDTVENRKKTGIPVPTPEQIEAAEKEIAAAFREFDENKIAKQRLAAEEASAAKAALAKAALEKKQATLAKVVKFNQEQADKGDVIGLLRMGERYRDGDGVEKDLAKAKAYLQKAADAGSPTAADELSKFNQSSTNAKPAP